MMERLSTAGLHEVLLRIAPAIEAGSVNVVSVAAIRDRLGPRWARKREQVEAFLVRAFSRATPGGMLVPLNDIEFVAIHPDLSRWAALGGSAKILREALTFFLGDYGHDDIRLLLVTGYEDGQLTVEPVPTRGREPLPDEGWGAALLGGAPVVPDDPSPAPLRRPVRREPPRTRPLRHGGQDIEVMSSWHPTWNVRRGVVASFLIETHTGPAAIGTLPAALHGEVAACGLFEALEGIREGCAAGAPVAIHAPFPLDALAHSTSRNRLLRILAGVEADVRRLLVLEITGVPEGLPSGRMEETVSMLSPYARAILARAPCADARFLQWRRCGLHGISLDCSGLEPADSRMLERLSAFARNALALAPACVAYGLPSSSFLLAAWAAGFTHLGGPTIEAGVDELAAVRLNAADLYLGRRTDRGAPISPARGGQEPVSQTVRAGGNTAVG